MKFWDRDVVQLNQEDGERERGREGGREEERERRERKRERDRTGEGGISPFLDILLYVSNYSSWRVLANSKVIVK